ncbi:MAG: hypothetical protein N4A71_11230 [Carboxylicivirga sp.]|jgi:hypothetical protein|nr:hypothetical protein [Carboxylicivirga sp.]MCT4643820.1 hypothetical protein [Carboxylicivirga sp.]
MKIRTFIYILFFCCLAFKDVKGQQQVWLHGKIVRESDHKAIPLAQIASYKKLNMFAADSTGEFKVILDADDSIKVVSLAFESKVFRLDSLNIESDQMYLFPLKQTSYEIQQVDINSNRHYRAYKDKLGAELAEREEMDLMLPGDIELGRKPDMPLDDLPTYRSKPSVTAAVFQPANFIYYYASKSEKQKRRMMKLRKQDKQRNMLTVHMMAEVSGLKDEALQEFVIYCNANIKFSKKDTPLSVKYKVIDLFKAFKDEE